jgi:hypothetical protein
MAKFGARTTIGSILRTAEWARMPLALRERAFFSAGVENVRALQGMQRDLAADLAMARDESGGWRDRSTFIANVRSTVAGLRNEAGGLREDIGDTAGMRLNDPRNLKDLASRRRAGLIYDQAIQSAHGYARWQTDNDPDILDAFPAQELLPSSARRPRDDWERRWVAAGGQVIDGRIVGLKTDPAWIKLNRFGVPWPPFDFGSTRVLMDIDRAEAEDLGLINPGERINPAAAEFNDNLEASVRDLSAAFKEALEIIFGDQITLQGDAARWTGRAA